MASELRKLHRRMIVEVCISPAPNLEILAQRGSQGRFRPFLASVIGYMFTGARHDQLNDRSAWQT